MENKQSQIYLKIQELLSFFHRTEADSQIHLMSFVNKRASLLDKKKLRQNLIQQIKSHKNYKEKSYNWAEFLQINTKPFFPTAGISISYSNYLGVSLIVFDKQVSIGFDIEHKDRVSSQVAQRISSQEELSQCPHPALLWVAKEAGVKSLSNPQSSVLLKECILSNWKQVSDQNYFFDFCMDNSSKYKGSAGFLNDFVIAYAEKPY